MDAAAGPFWRGINHLALVTTDMDATVRFWHGVLGARLVAHLGNESFRHYFFEFGPQQTVAFFEYANLRLERFQLPAGVPDRRKISSITCRSTCRTRTRCTSCGTGSRPTVAR
jgi:catechol 2,3-dioxygenase-like lactoylglutathione lyase family enzyme